MQEFLGLIWLLDEREHGVTRPRSFIVASARWLAVIALLLTGTTCREEQRRSMSSLTPSSVEMPALPDETDVPVAAVYVQQAGLSLPDASTVEGPRVIVAIWKDGRAVWSQDRLMGGPPYQTANVDPEQLTTFVNELESAGVFRDPSLNDPRFGPDSDYTVVAVADAYRALHMRSWHELFESNPKLVVTSRGVMPLNGRDRQAVLRSEPESYRRFRRVWKNIRAKLAAILPKEGRPAEKLRFELRSVRIEKAGPVPPAEGE